MKLLSAKTAFLSGMQLNWAANKCLIKSLGHKDFYDLCDQTDSRWYQTCCDNSIEYEQMLNALTTTILKDVLSNWDVCRHIFNENEIRLKQKPGYPAEAQMGEYLTLLGGHRPTGRHIYTQGTTKIEAGLRCFSVASLGDITLIPEFPISVEFDSHTTRRQRHRGG